ncbi:hypothetical protein ACFLIM_25400 [Nonomuraea sp. M3C6]|uniref:Uncharacterized protein n=1 Tax=Nonomuraea marmarensis TaxID=3351344 RepID=A0ABW7AGQ5_9ACTN
MLAIRAWRRVHHSADHGQEAQGRAAFQRALERAQRYIHEADTTEITQLLAAYLKGIDPKALTELPGLMRTEIPERTASTRDIS